MRANRITEGNRAGKPGPPLQIWVLGGLRVAVGARLIDASAWRLRRATGLLKLLASTPTHRLHKEQIVEALWPGVDVSAGTNNLHQVLHFTRRTLEPDLQARGHPRFLRLEGDVIVLGSEEQVWVDADAFEAAVDASLRTGDLLGLRTAADLYAGDLLPDDLYEDWAAARREVLRSKHIDVLSALARVQEDRGDLDPALVTVERLLAADPAHEDGHVTRMRLLAKKGRTGEAMRQYARFRAALKRELGVEPTPAAQSLQAFIATTPAPRHNLPAQLTTFVGRAREIRELKSHLRSERLVTLAGPGGSGKTRLVLRVAEEMLSEFPGGAWFVELAPVTKPEGATWAVAAALMVRVEGHRSLQAAIADALRPQEVMLILDNCEHLTEVCADLVTFLLRECPGLRILVTARQPLHVTGEQVWRVPPLALPSRGQATPADVLPFDAVQLLVERGRLTHASFVLGEANAGSIAELCHHLDGLPLAIELAAARLSSFSVEEILKRLSDRFRLLATAGTAAPSRQQTLRATIDWSYNLLTDREQALFDRLSVFRGGFALEAVETICAGNGIQSGEVLDIVAALVEKSMVAIEQTPEGSMRYGLLESLLQYGGERLQGTGNTDKVASAHAQFYLALSEGAEPHLAGPEQETNLRRLETEHDNIRAALDWLAENDIHRAFRLGGSLWRFWTIRGFLTEGRARLDRLLQRGHSGDTSEERAGALFAAGVLAHRQGSASEALNLLEEALSIYRQRGDMPRMARTLNNLGIATWHQGQLARAHRFLDESLRVSRSLGDRVGTAAALNNFGLVAMAQGHYESAAAAQKEALAIDRELGDQYGVASQLGNLGNIARDSGDPTSRQYYDECLAIRRELRDSQGLAIALGDLGEALRRAGDVHGARIALNESLALVAEVGDRRCMARTLNRLGLIALADEDFDAAGRMFREALEQQRNLDDVLGMAETLNGFAILAFAKSDTRAGVRFASAAEAIRERTGSSPAPSERENVERALKRVRSGRNAQAYQAAWDEGRQLPLEKVLDDSLATRNDAEAISGSHGLRARADRKL